MSGPLALDSLDLAALLCSRVCHDLISPVGAIMNGLEVMEDEKSEETRAFAMTLIKNSARTASAKLQFCRLAFGAAGSAGAQIDTGDAEQVTRGMLDDEKTKISWGLPRALLPKNQVKLVLNMTLIAAQSIPRGGAITVESAGEGGEGGTMGFRVTATGVNARVPQAAAALVSGTPDEVQTVDAHAIQPLYTALLAKQCGLTVSVAPEGEAIVVRAQ